LKPSPISEKYFSAPGFFSASPDGTNTFTKSSKILIPIAVVNTSIYNNK
jgi:hypothetical protein